MIRNLGMILNNQIRSVIAPIIRKYESDISLKSLYPKSNQKLTSPLPPSAVICYCYEFFNKSFNIENDINVIFFQHPDGKFNGYIPMNQVNVVYSRSSGPGGQNVNKVDTKVDLRFHLKTAEWIPELVRERMAVAVSFIN